MSDENGTAETSQYYIRARGKIMGPFSLERLQTMRSRGQLSRIHEISVDKQNWQTAASFMFSAPADEGYNLSADEEQDPLEKASQASSDSKPPEPIGNKAAWYYHVAGEMNGPVSIMDLRSLVSSRQLTSGELVWREGFADWIPISDVPELRHLTSGMQSHPGTSQTMAHMSSSDVSMGQTSGQHIPHPRTSGLAITGISLGVLGLSFSVLSAVAQLLSSVAVLLLVSFALAFGFFSIFSIIFSAVALKDISQSRGHLTGQGLASAGLITGIMGTIGWAFWLFYFIDITRVRL
ncbi:GYF domain-containing protein [Blastopirellula marina]|uniref:GYF domain-containing protein n=1 Tax=Blastopirellula marina TaxID=124 RepID=A0A2S8F7T7_9BACT|nr:GYF domain-containing protein [Blastopirellula marina]PQO28215.1 hypothetical protein C5Y98_25280 [Blastopirellula marina]PTL41755.1 DUF4339 domain-containing protein [Blastopirellula marina]